MQFLWRDLTSGFDVVGPYFTSSKNFENKTILSCLLETLRTFHVHGFKTCLLVCDAASAWDNLKIDVYGFSAFCEWFFMEYLNYYVVPIQITGSAVEMLFAQYKYLLGNKLDAVNYTTARSKYI